MNHFITGFVLSSGLAILACSSTDSNASNTTDGGGTGGGSSGASNGGSSGASSGGSSGGGAAGSSGASSGGSSGGGAAGSSGANSGGSSGRGAGGSSGGGAGGSSGSSGGSAGSTGGRASTDGGVDVCSTCDLGDLCVEHLTEGGAQFFPDDAGNCPFGRVPTSGPNPYCVLPPSYTCETLPAACTPPPGSPPVAHCICARSLCGSANLCTDVSPTLMKCTMQVP